MHSSISSIICSRYLVEDFIGGSWTSILGLAREVSNLGNVAFQGTISARGPQYRDQCFQILKLIVTQEHLSCRTSIRPGSTNGLPSIGISLSDSNQWL